ncbi:DUF485 domain-containing protein [Bradyrhizobium sp. USDA 4529]
MPGPVCFSRVNSQRNARTKNACRLRRDLEKHKGRTMVHTGTSSEAAHASIRVLVGEKLRYLVPMTIMFMTCYIGLTILAAFAKGVVGMKIVGSVNLGFVLIAFNYVLSWALAIAYGFIAQKKFDPLAARAAAASRKAE